MIPILASDDEFIAMEQAKLQGKEPSAPKGIVRKPNKAFYDWVEQNKERMETATTMPYWVQDNQDYITGKKGQKKVRTDAEREAIRKAWAERAKKNQQTLAKAGYVAKYAADYPEIDLMDLQVYIAAKNVTKAQAEAKAVAKQMAAINKDATLKIGSIIKDLKAKAVAYNKVSRRTSSITEKDMIARLGGGDLTSGSCSSLAFAYAGNKNGWEVLDFRGGDSLDFFATRSNIEKIAEAVKGTIVEEYNDFEAAKQLISKLVDDKLYYFVCGSHAAIIRKTATGLEYLELQSATNNGFHPLTTAKLIYRFGAESSRSYKTTSILIETTKLKRAGNFQELLGYINTDVVNQMKGKGGTTK